MELSFHGIILLHLLKGHAQMYSVITVLMCYIQDNSGADNSGADLASVLG